MINKKLIIIDTGSELTRIMMQDLGRLSFATQISDIYCLNSSILKLLFKIHFGFKANYFFDLPYKELWDKKNILSSLIADKNTQYYIIMINDSIRKFSGKYLKKLNLMKNVSVIVVLLDAVEYMQPYFRRMINKVNSNNIYSFQKSDCKKYGYRYTNCLYSKIEDIDNVVTDKYDMVFVGKAKNRMKEIAQIFKYLYNNKLNCKFIVVAPLFKIFLYRYLYPGIDFRFKNISYLEIIKTVLASKCIVEICQKKQDGVTMRFYEAVFYNKFLLSNNKGIRDNLLYNSKYMVAIENIKKLDLSFYSRNIDVDYNYNNEVSPINLLKDITDSINNKGFLK